MYNQSSNSRLTRKIEKNSKRTIWLAVIGMIFVIFLLFKFGIPLLINFSIWVGGHGSSQDTPSDSNNPSFISPPVLDHTFTATNSAQIKISGSAQPHETIELYVNSNKVDAQDTKDDGTFTFDNVSITQGDNQIAAKAKVKSVTSDFSQTLIITLKKNAPQLNVTNPSDGASFSKDNNSVTVSGQTDPDTRVTVNGFWAIVDDKGNFTYTLSLQNGDNQIKVIAVDPAGNNTEKDLKVTYSQ